MTPRLSVVLATYNRAEGLRRLLRCLAAQTLPHDAFEVVVVDDGSATPAAQALQDEKTPFALRLLAQANAGAAVARDKGVHEARGEVIVIVDDDMRVEPGFLEAHLRRHGPGTHAVVMGPIRPDDAAHDGAFELWNAARLQRFSHDAAEGRVRLRGNNLCTGNVSFRREDYLRVGGFDASLRKSEDAELGLRLEKAACEFVFAADAEVFHGSDHDNHKWRARAHQYGLYDAAIARKHADVPHADPWRYLFSLPLLGRPIVFGSVLAPWLSKPAAGALLATAEACNKLGLRKAAVRGAGIVYGMEYFRGLREDAGSLRASLRAVGHYLASVAQAPAEDRPAVPRRTAHLCKALADLRADHGVRQFYEDKYGYAGEHAARLRSDVVVKIGVQMMAAIRVMKFWNDAGPRIFAKMSSRMIRHLYGSDVHWEATFAPGVNLVHGFGLAICREARIGPRCILSQNVTLGLGTDPVTGKHGGPTLEADVHVGPGVTIIGPVTIGAGTKIMPGCVVIESVPPGSRVEVPRPTVVARTRGPRPAPAAAEPVVEEASAAKVQAS